MEKLLLIYDDADDWLSTLWLAAGPMLWALIVVLLATVILAGSVWITSASWAVGSIAVLTGGLIPVAKHLFF